MDLFQEARDFFVARLNPKEKILVESATDPDSLLEEVKAVAQNHQDQSFTRKLILHMKPFVRGVEQYGKALDILTNAKPEILSLLWGGARILLHLAGEFIELFEKMAEMLSRIGKQIGMFEIYAKLYPSSQRLKERLIEAYVSFLDCCAQVKALLSEERPKRSLGLKSTSMQLLLKSTWKPIKPAFFKVIENMEEAAEDVRREADLAEKQEASEAREKAQIEARYAKDKAVFDWLDPVDVEANHRKARSLHEPSTGVWITSSQQFQSWMNKPGSSLWLHAKAGAGKTILSSTVITYLQERSFPPSMPIVYYYCDYKNAKSQQPVEVFRTILANLSRVNDEVLEFMESFSKKYRKFKTSCSVEVLHQALINCAKLVGRVFIVIDALDECIERSELLEKLANIANAQTNINIFLTSRKEFDIEQYFESIPKLSIDSTDVASDVEVFVNNQLLGLIKTRKLKLRDPDLRIEIQKILTAKADGMFQWVRCQLDSLCRAISDKAIRTALKDLPVGLDDTYIRIFKRLQEDFPGEIDTVKQIFFWITHSMRPLAVEELAEALFFTEDNGSLDLSSVPTDPLDLLKFGGSLLTLTDGKKIIGLSHFSVKEFLLSERIRKSAVSDFYADEALTHHDIVDTSLSYLIMKDFNSGQCMNQKRLKARFESFQYLRYGASHWMDHYKKLDNTDTEALDQRVFQFFTDTNMKGNVLAWQQIKDNWGNRYWNWKYPNPVYPFGRTGKPGGFNLSLSINPIYYAAYYGVWPLAKLLLDTGHDPNGQGGHFKYPVLAAAFGQVSTWEFIDKFIKAGADINVYSDKGSVAYANATLGAPQDWWLLKDLAIAGAEINEYPTLEGSSILSIIAGHPSQPLQMVEILLKHGACPNDSQAHYEDAMYGLHYATPLQNSVKSNNPAITQALLDAGADINLSAGDLGTPLQVAIRFKYPETARFLIEKGADVNIAGGTFGSPLQAAVWSGDMSILQLLIDNGSNVDTPGGISGCALSAAIARRHNDAIETLLRQNPDVNSGKAHDFYEYEDELNDLSLDMLKIGLSTPLNWALFYQDLAMIERLISLGADLNAPLQRCSASLGGVGPYQYHPLCLALDDGNSEIIELLLERGADPSIGDFCAAMVAASKDQFELFTLFIKEVAAGPSLEKILLEALIYTRSLSWDFERNLFNLIGQNLFDENEEVAIGALRAAITAGSEMKVQGLLLCGANVESEAESRYFRKYESYFIRKPLLLAISPNKEAIGQNKKAIVDILLDHGVDVNVFSEHCGTPLGLAVKARDSELTTKLLSHGANFSQPCWKNISCGNIFHLAVQSGDLQVVDILLQWGAKATQQCDYCPTALSCAVTSEHCEMIRKLVQSGGDVNERDFYGHSILQRAQEAHLDEAVALLLSLGAESNSSSDGLSSHLENSIRHLTQKLSIQLNTENFELPQRISSRRWMILGNCLFLGNDPRNAIIALEQSLPVDDSAKTYYHSLDCKMWSGSGLTTYHLCKSGDTMIWCEKWCVETHWHYLKDLDAYETHEYLRYPREFFRDIPDGDVALDRDTFIPREKWLESLKGWIFKEREDPAVLLCSELGVWSQ